MHIQSLIFSVFSLTATTTLAVAVRATNSSRSSNGTNYNGELRPQVHFSPPSGFMNDPNGMFYDPAKKLYHLYYQYNPFETVAGNQHWGHATSKDLYHWINHPIALYPDGKDKLIFSGSAVADPNNTSGFFPGQKDGIVAIYTVHSPTKENQHIAYSTDGGYTFTKYKGNPVIDSTSKNFRDPQVTWHENTQAWVMAVAYATDRVIGFYTSTDLKKWNHASNFTQDNIPGVQLECPNLVYFPSVKKDEDKEGPSSAPKYVLFISVNPGAPLGGSGTLYFVGNFNGTHFVPENPREKETLYNFCKDDYAAQWFSGIPHGHDPVSIAWASNWDYTNLVPTGEHEGWRGADSLPRSHSLVRDDDGRWKITQVPFGNLSSIKEERLVERRLRDGKNVTVDFSRLRSKAVYFDVKIQGGLSASDDDFASFILTGAVTFNFTSSSSADFLDGGLTLDKGLFWVNRGGTHMFTANDNGNFTAGFSTPVHVNKSKDNGGSLVFEGVIDRSLFEVFLEGGKQTGTVSFFSRSPLDRLVVCVSGIGMKGSVDVDVWGLESGWSRSS